MRSIATLILGTAVMLLAACSSDDPTFTPTPTATTSTPTATPTLTATPPPVTATPTATPTAPPSASPAPAAVVVTFRVADSEEYRILLNDPIDIAIAEKLLAGEEAPGIPNGRVVRDGPGVNTGYSWHIDPASVEFADFTIEVCDGLPSHVEEGSITDENYCPWSAKVIAIEPARTNP